MNDGPKVVVIGAGPTGLGAAWRMEEIGHRNWAIYEASDHPGGLASSVVDEQGFTWDLGGHVLFSHYRYFDRLMELALEDRWNEHMREAWVRMRHRWVPYPFQNNIWRLPTDDLIACIDGLLRLHSNSNHAEKPKTFEDWLRRSFGTGLCDIFMFPYNKKVWAYPPDRLDVGWMGERVATVDLRRILYNLVQEKDDAGWGPNTKFRFPNRGGTGAIWRSIHAQLPADRIHLRRPVVSIDTSKQTIELADGEVTSYDHLLSTMPLDTLLGTLVDAGPLQAYAPQFIHSSSHIVGIGFEGGTPDDLQTKCWMYFPESNTPFYRATVFSNYSANNVARPEEQWSLMAEISESPHKLVDHRKVVQETVDGFRQAGLTHASHRVVSKWHKRLEHGYPTPWLGRDEVLGPVEDALVKRSIYSRGRFGAWKYEVSNQDHSVMQGVEAVERILNGGQEFTFNGEMRDHLAEPVAETQ